MNWTILSGEYPVLAGRGPSLPPDAVEVDWPPSEAGRWRLVAGAWTLRPELGTPVIAVGTVSLASCPSGTVAEVTDISGHEIMGTVAEAGGLIEITLPDAGHYAIEYLPPLPHVGRLIRVTVDP